MASGKQCPFVRFDSGTALVCCAALLPAGFCSDPACRNQPAQGPRCLGPRYDDGKGRACGAEVTPAGACSDEACELWKKPQHRYPLRSAARAARAALSGGV